MRVVASLFAAVLVSSPVPAHAERWMPGSFLLTEYWIARESPGEVTERAVRVFSPQGAHVTWCSPDFLSALTMEGTGRTWDGRMLNWASRVNGRPCFVEIDTALYPFGVGVQGYALVPYRSLAVDPRYVPIGHVVEMPELRGITLPDGSTHDGCFIAADGGGAIRGHHIDLFLPSRDEYEHLNFRRELPRRVSVGIDVPRCASAMRYLVLPLPETMPGDPWIIRRL